MNLELIATKRKELHFTQDELSKILNIPLTSYRNIEKGNHLPNVVVALELCLILKLNPFEVWL